MTAFPAVAKILSIRSVLPVYVLPSRANCILWFAFVFPVFADPPGHGIQNFHQVNQHVYRGAQPSHEGFVALAKMGVKTVIDLREPGQRSRAEERLVTAAGMKYVNVPMSGLVAPTESEINRILAILEDEAAGPVFVHCKRGADRTGAVIASYRIDHDRWENDKALSEAKELGMSFFQLPRQSFIRSFQPRTVEARSVANSTPAAPAPATTVP